MAVHPVAHHEPVLPLPAGLQTRAAHTHHAPHRVTLHVHPPQTLLLQDGQTVVGVVGVPGHHPVRPAHASTPPRHVVGVGHPHPVTQTRDQTPTGVPRPGHRPAGPVRAHGPGRRIPPETGQQVPVSPDLLQASGRVVGPLQHPARGLCPAYRAPGGVPGPGGGASQRVGVRYQAPHGVPGAGGPVASRVGHRHLVGQGVVLVAGHPARTIHGRHQLAGRVVAQTPRPVPGVLDGGDAPALVVAETHHPTPRGTPLHNPPRGVKAGGHPAAVGPDLADQARVGVVEDLVAVPAGGHGRRPPAAPVVLVAVDAPRRLGDRYRPAGGVTLVAGDRAGGVHGLNHAPAPVVAHRLLGAVRPGDGHDPPQAVAAGLQVLAPVVHGHDLAQGAALHVAAHASGVLGGGHQAVGPVADRPLPARGVLDVRQVGQGVVAQLPRGAVRQPHAGQVAQVVVPLAHHPAQGVGRRLDLPVLPPGHRGAPAHGVDPGRHAPRGGVLKAPPAPRGVRAGGQQPRVRVVPVLGTVPQRGDGRHHPACGVTLQARHGPLGVGDGHQLTEVVVGEVHTHPGGIHHPGQQSPRTPQQSGDPALRIHHTTGLPGRALVDEPGHGFHPGPTGPVVGTGDGGGHQAVELVPLPGLARPRGQTTQDYAAPLVEDARRGLPVPGAHHDLVAPPVVPHGLAPPLGVNDPHQAAAPVVDPGVAPRTVLVAGGRHPAGQVGVAGGTPERGALRGHAPRLVERVGHLYHAVSVHDLGQQARLVPPVGP